MSGLYTSLTMAARALNAQQMGLQVTGNNIVNVNTAGYSRRAIDFAAQQREHAVVSDDRCQRGFDPRPCGNSFPGNFAHPRALPSGGTESRLRPDWDYNNPSGRGTAICDTNTAGLSHGVAWSGDGSLLMSPLAAGPRGVLVI